MSNKQDANASAPTQQQVQGSIQAQDTLPSASLMALPQYEQNTIVLQFNSKQQRGQPINSLLIIITIILMTIGVIVWVLNITDTIKGPWSSLCAALFTAIGTFITLLQLYAQFTTVPGSAATTIPLLSDVQPSNSLNGDSSIPRPSRQEGILVVYTKRSLRGSDVDLCRGYRIEGNTYTAQNIVEQKIRGQTYYTAVFESLLPGSYTAHIYMRKMTAKITIYPGKVTTIDWRQHEEE
jgi:hypothetical protein